MAAWCLCQAGASSAVMTKTWLVRPWRKAFRRQRALPSSVRGPVGPVGVIGSVCGVMVVKTLFQNRKARWVTSGLWGMRRRGPFPILFLAGEFAAAERDSWK